MNKSQKERERVRERVRTVSARLRIGHPRVAHGHLLKVNTLLNVLFVESSEGYRPRHTLSVAIS